MLVVIIAWPTVCPTAVPTCPTEKIEKKKESYIIATPKLERNLPDQILRKATCQSQWSVLDHKIVSFWGVRQHLALLLFEWEHLVPT